ncbi:MAG: hypothetical protein HY517_00560 [Candidatus Aenigmarchaeota archaeon]|nr:hypothetical protein [Candidatus Aenigmarchaeota archaeon]
MRTNLQYFEAATIEGLARHALYSLLSSSMTRLGENYFLDPDPNPYFYAAAHLSAANMWRILKEKPYFTDDVGIFMGAAIGYSAIYKFLG